MEEILRKALDKVSKEDSAEYMAELLMDENTTTWKMFEELAYSWINGNEDFRNGLNDAVILITGWSLDTIAKELFNKYEEGEI